MEKELKQEKEAFLTHYNYAECLNCLVNKCSVKCNLNLNKKGLPLLRSKQNLIDLTKRSLEEEHKIVEIDKDYSYASTSWLPIKSYYLLFNQMLTIEYIILADKKAFNLTHKKCIERFTKRLENKEIEFNDLSIINKVYDKGIFNCHDIPGANLSKKISHDRMFVLAMHKIADYKLEEWRRVKKIESFRKKENKKKKEEFLNKFRLSVFEFPYYMRIKANYRDFAFIDAVSSKETALYFNSYYSLTIGFYNRLKELEKQLLMMRSSK